MSKQINFTIVPDEPGGSGRPVREYANFCAVAHTPFDLTLTTNEDAERSALVARHRPASGSVVESEPTGLDWPGDFFSLSHVALPISPDDPIYGDY